MTVCVVSLPTHEANKSFDLVFEIAKQLEHFKLNRWVPRSLVPPCLGPAAASFIFSDSPCRRKEPIIAIGGGVCLDVAGLAANLYRRNTPIIKVCLGSSEHVC